MDSFRPLMGRTLVLVAHPDDEAVGCGVLLQRMNDPLVVFATDGAPRSDYFWKEYGSRERYAQERSGEAERALTLGGGSHFHFLCEEARIADQELHLELAHAYEALSRLIEMEMPEAILSHAYEGGHPDHDACCFLSSVAAKQYALPAWEFPLYHRRENEIRRQEFVDPAGEQVLAASADESRRKQEMLAAYGSQAHVVAEFAECSERFRRMSAYDFSGVPHEGVLNYEAWQWPMKGNELCLKFEEFLQHKSETVRKRKWGTVA